MLAVFVIVPRLYIELVVSSKTMEYASPRPCLSYCSVTWAHVPPDSGVNLKRVQYKGLLVFIARLAIISPEWVNANPYTFACEYVALPYQ